ncbi:DEAD/DEAH box helicase [Butyricicoccus sp.]|uniref:DEAD/DEAH box helicase n=1 Tax=Butyricicoccus sp. TaxID=2049021 RepID=UPI003F1645BC
MSIHTNETAEAAVTFEQLGLSPAVLRAISEMGFEQPTEIQARAIPAVLSGSDIIGRSHTGTGKTMAFGVPAVECCLQHADCRETQVLVLCPTRELAMQACDEVRKLTRYTQAIRAVALYGGQPIQNQIPQLRRGAEIVIGTPGRIMDHIHRHTLKLDNLSMVVLDEADEMLNMGFREDIESILSYVPDGHQTLLFSATMPQAILDITDQYQHDPLMIETKSGPERTMDTIEQYYYEVPLGSKMDALTLLLHTHEPKLSIIFCNTKKMVEELNRYLSEHGFHCSMLHGDMKQEARTAVMQAFKSGRTPILIATDVAARGIDVDDVDAVYNFDIPQDYEYYIHRIGRTGRAGKSGMSYTLAAGRRQVFQVRDISRFIGAPIAHKPLPCTQDIIDRKKHELVAEIREQLQKPGSSDCNPLIVKLMDEGYSPEKLAESMMELLLQREMTDVPVLAIPRPVGGKQSGSPLPPPPEGYVRLRFSVGRYQRVAPNHIVAAIAEATRIPGKQIQKIYCYGEYSLVEVPSKYKNVIIQKVSGTKIGGHKTDVRLYDSKNPKAACQSSSRGGGDKSASSRGRRPAENHRRLPSRSPARRKKTGHAH